MEYKFSQKEINEIADRTNYNDHGGNYEFIAKKINSSLLGTFKKINRENTEGLDTETVNRRYKAYQKLMKELKRKNPSQYEEIHGSL